MDLHGKPVAGEDVLGEKGKTAARPGFSVQLGTVFFRSLGERHSRRWAVQEARSIIRDPHLADALFGEGWPPVPAEAAGISKSGVKSRRPQIFGLKDCWRA